jgi:hypothetical protein
MVKVLHGAVLPVTIIKIGTVAKLMETSAGTLAGLLSARLQVYRLLLNIFMFFLIPLTPFGLFASQ